MSKILCRITKNLASCFYYTPNCVKKLTVKNKISKNYWKKLLSVNAIYHISRKWMNIPPSVIFQIVDGVSDFLYFYPIKNSVDIKTRGRGCKFSEHSLCAVPLVKAFEFSDRIKCPIPCRSQVFLQKSIQYNTKGILRNQSIEVSSLIYYLKYIYSFRLKIL